MKAYYLLNNLRTAIRKKTKNIEYEKLNIRFFAENSEIHYDSIDKIPDIKILQKQLENPEVIQYEVYVDGSLLKQGNIPLYMDDEEDDFQPREISNSGGLPKEFEKLFQAQISLTQNHLSNLAQVYDIKQKALSESFEQKLIQQNEFNKQMLENQKIMFEQRLELEKERIELQSGFDSEPSPFLEVFNGLKEFLSENPDVSKILIDAISKKPVYPGKVK